MQRAIHIFPAFQNMNEIEEVRKKYDPLYGYIPPHITLVFPFVSELTSAGLEQHVKDTLAGVRPFTIQLAGITASDQNLFLNVKKGNDMIIELHDKLYTGALSDHLNRRYTYTPHITVGRLHQETELHDALRDTQSCHTRFEAQVTQVTSEIIERSGASTIDFIISFT